MSYVIQIQTDKRGFVDYTSSIQRATAHKNSAPLPQFRDKFAAGRALCDLQRTTKGHGFQYRIVERRSAVI